jgi:nitrite reductase/ring-hydroxylating ferredoxin subunit
MSGETTRRAVLAGVVGTTAAAALAACGGDTETAAPPPRNPNPAANAAPIARTTDIPVNGGKIFTEQVVVVTQPAEGQFKAFSATCTHKGCLLAGVEDGAIICKCHGARFDVTDGSVAKGPATAPLTSRNIKVSGDSIALA